MAEAMPSLERPSLEKPSLEKPSLEKLPGEHSLGGTDEMASNLIQ
jgi:hypothetical protein